MDLIHLSDDEIVQAFIYENANNAGPSEAHYLRAAQTPIGYQNEDVFRQLMAGSSINPLKPDRKVQILEARLRWIDETSGDPTLEYGALDDWLKEPISSAGYTKLYNDFPQFQPFLRLWAMSSHVNSSEPNAARFDPAVYANAFVARDYSSLTGLQHPFPRYSDEQLSDDVFQLLDVLPALALSNARNHVISLLGSSSTWQQRHVDRFMEQSGGDYARAISDAAYLGLAAQPVFNALLSQALAHRSYADLYNEVAPDARETFKKAATDAAIAGNIPIGRLKGIFTTHLSHYRAGLLLDILAANPG